MKKLISMFLVFIILISQFGTIIAANYVTAWPENRTLEAYLIKNGVDEDENRELSDEEWANVKSLDTDGIDYKNADFSKLSNLENLSLYETHVTFDLSELNNLKSLSLTYCNLTNNDLSKLNNLESLLLTKCDLTNADLSKLNSLTNLRINNCDLTNVNFSGLTELKNLCIFYYDHENIISEQNLNLSSLTQLKDLEIYDSNSGPVIKKIDLSGDNNLTDLILNDTYDCNITLPEDLSKIEYVDIFSNTIDKVDLSNVENFNGGYFSSTNNHWNKSNVIIGDENLSIERYDSNQWNVFYREPEIRITSTKQKIEEYELKNIFGGSIDTENLNHSKLIENDVEGNIIIKGTGTEQIKVVDDWGRKHPVTLTIFENNPDTTLENKGITGKFIDDHVVLKSNGELWNINSPTEAEIIDTNVVSYDASICYGEKWWEPFEKTYLLKKDGTLIVTAKFDDHEVITEKEIRDVQDVRDGYYLMSNGELYTIECNDIMQKIITKKVTTGVKKLVGDCIILNDNTTWVMDDKKLEKVAEFEIVEGGFIHEQNDELDRDNMYYLDQARTLYELVGQTLEKKIEHFQGQLYDYIEVYIVDKYAELSGELQNNTYYSWTESKILDNVKTASGCYDYEHIIYDMLVRTDGSIWTYSDLLGLNKITKSSSQDNPTDEGKYITSPSIKEKKVGNQAVVTGMNPNTTIQNFIGQNNFNTQYTVKVLNANKVEIEKSNLMGTGYTIQLLKNNGLVQQYIAVIYGDTTGDGQINSFDALTLIKAINNKVAFKGEAYQEAGRIMTKSGQTPTALDALAIIKSANKKYTIEQFK